MGNASYVLLNDRAFIQIARYKMGSSANQLDTAGMSLVIRLGTLKAW